jgi:hypothetical protein
MVGGIWVNSRVFVIVDDGFVFGLYLDSSLHLWSPK